MPQHCCRLGGFRVGFVGWVEYAGYRLPARPPRQAALQTLSAPWPRPAPQYAFTALRPRLALIVILLPEHGASRAKAEIVCCCLRLKSHFVVQAPTPPLQPPPASSQRPYAPHTTVRSPPAYLLPRPCHWQPASLKNWRTILQLNCEHKSREIQFVIVAC